MLKLTRSTRKNILGIVNGLTIEQINQVPKDFSNNIFWNFGHVVITQQLLTYGLSGLPLKLDKQWVERLRKGTRPEQKYEQENLDFFIYQSESLLKQFEQDYQAGIFKAFKPYSTSYGITLNSLEEAVRFNDLHEALHLGYIMAIRKAIS